MIPNKCTVPVGDYESYADFEEVIMPSYAIYDDTAKTFNFVRSPYAPEEGGTFVAPGGIVLSCTNVFPVYEANNAAPAVAMLTFEDEDGTQHVEYSRDPDDITMATMVQKYEIMPQAAEYATMTTAAASTAQPWVGAFSSKANVERGVFYDDVVPSSVVSFFSGFSEMLRIDGINHLDVSFCSDFTSMFSNNSKLTSLNIGHFNLSDKTLIINNMFEGCRSLSSLNFDLANKRIKSMYKTFSNCDGLTTIDLSGATIGVGSISSKSGTDCRYAFSSCDNLQTVDFTNATGSLLNMVNTFYGCKSLKNVIFDGADLSVLGMYNTFTRCSSLTSLDLTNLDLTPCGTMYGTFEECTKLENISFNKNKKRNSGINVARTFANCSSLKNIDLSFLSDAAFTSLEHTFSGCASITQIDLSPISSNEMVMYGPNLALSGWQGTFSHSGIEHIDLTAFPNHAALDSTFAHCTNLKTIRLWDDVPVFEGANDSSIYLPGTFTGCSSLTTIYSDATYPADSQVSPGNTFGMRTFQDCLNLVGGSGTTYDSWRVQQTYARPDGGPDSETPGYFTPSSEYPGTV